MKERANLIAKNKINKENTNFKIRNENINNNKKKDFNKKLSLNYNNKKSSINKFLGNNNLINTKNYMDIYVNDSKIKRNTNIIMNEIIKILNLNKMNNKNSTTNRNARENIFSPSKDEIILIQNNEHGKTLRCIKKRCKDKSTYTENKNKEINKSESSQNNFDYIINIASENKNNEENINKDENENKVENKNNEGNKRRNIKDIKIPGEEIEALRRIKLKIENYKKSQEKFKKIEYK